MATLTPLPNRSPVAMLAPQISNQHTTPKGEIRTQYAALCYRMVQTGHRILLITSRGSGRWILPKGWPIDGLKPAAAAAQEAWEEAGVIGRVLPDRVGDFGYTKLLEDGTGVPCRVTVYPLQVTSLARDFPEQGQRKRKWVTPDKAALRVDEPELAALLRAFDPRALADMDP